MALSRSGILQWDGLCSGQDGDVDETDAVRLAARKLRQHDNEFESVDDLLSVVDGKIDALEAKVDAGFARLESGQQQILDMLRGGRGPSSSD